MPIVRCPNCREEFEMTEVLTAQSNQNVIFQCPSCKIKIKNIETSKG